MKRNTTSQAGQSLIMLLVFITMAITITTGAVTVTLLNSRSTTTWYQGEQTLQVAEAGVENAIIRLLRDPTYTGETLTVDSGTATISVTGTSPKTITVEALSGTFKRRIQVIGSFTNNTFSITSWKEID